MGQAGGIWALGHVMRSVSERNQSWIKGEKMKPNSDR